MPGEVQAGYQDFLHQKDCQPLEWAAHGGGRVTVPGSVQEMTGHGTSAVGYLVGW